MLYRKIGKTEMKASIIGLGAEHLDNKPYKDVEDTIHAAVDRQINIIDVFMPGTQVRQNIGKALEGKRDRVLLQGHVGSVDLNQQYDISRDLPTCKKYFEDLLRYLRTDYIDFGMLFFIDTEEDFNMVFHTDILTYIQNLKQQGRVRAIGASSHNPGIARRVVDSGVVDLLMFSINPAFDRMPPQYALDSLMEDSFGVPNAYGINPDRASLYRHCESQEVSITVMKSLGAGKLLSAEHTPFAKPLTVGQCIHYALTRPAVASVLVGCQNAEQVAEATRYLVMTDEEKEYAMAIRNSRDDFRGSCVYCSHCLPCPANIDIANVNKYLDIALLDEKNIPPSIAQHYAALGSHGTDCIACGSCEGRCPFDVPIVANMQRAAEIFGI